VTEQELEQAYSGSTPAINPMLLPHTGLIVLDVDRRTYIGLSRDGTYWHMVQAATPEMAKAYEFVNADGMTVSPVATGDLVCSCPGGRFRQHCYRIDQAKEFERSIEEEARWGDLPEPEKALASA
jgi:hypothetical protein